MRLPPAACLSHPLLPLGSEAQTFSSLPWSPGMGGGGGHAGGLLGSKVSVMVSYGCGHGSCRNCLDGSESQGLAAPGAMPGWRVCLSEQLCGSGSMICPISLWRPCFPEGRIRQASAGNLWDSLLQDIFMLAGSVQVKAEGNAGSKSARRKITISARVSTP